MIILGNFKILTYYAPPLRPEGPRRCSDRGNAGGALVSSHPLWLLYALGVCVYLAGKLVWANYDPVTVLCSTCLTECVYKAGKLVWAKCKIYGTHLWYLFMIIIYDTQL